MLLHCIPFVRILVSSQNEGGGAGLTSQRELEANFGLEDKTELEFRLWAGPGVGAEVIGGAQALSRHRKNECAVIQAVLLDTDAPLIHEGRNNPTVQ